MIFSELVSPKQFKKLLQQGGYKRAPLIKQCSLASFNIQSFFESLADPSKVLLESNRFCTKNGFSIIGLRAADSFFVKNNKVQRKDYSYNSQEPLLELRNLMDQWKGPALCESIHLPLYSGAIGFFSYEASRLFLPLTLKPRQDSDFWDYGFWFFNQLYVYDHQNNQMNLCVSGHSYEEATLLMNALEQEFSSYSCYEPKKDSLSIDVNISSNFTPSAYEEAIEKARDYILKGHSYQVNLAQRLECQSSIDPWQVYKNLTSINPVAFAAYFDFGETQIICGSPERLVKVRNRHIETRPIAGTRRRGKTDEEDYHLAHELQTDAKEKAEHAMLVDLMRNDLGKVCEIGSVRLASYADLVKYTHVMHLESDVVGSLKPDIHPLDVIAAVFPGGTVTGVPKLRTMEIIDALEPSPRHLYTGTIGYISSTHELEFNIVIRSLMAQKSRYTFHVGGGITYDSSARREYKETLNKARSQLLALGMNYAKLKL